MQGVSGSDRMLERIVALLVALAIQADAAAGRSFPVRWLVLTILRRGELAASAWVAEATGWEWACFEDPGELCYEPDDAILLAARLRMLAAMLAALLDAGRGYPGCGRRIGDGHRLAFRAGRHAVAASGLAAGPYDTS